MAYKKTKVNERALPTGQSSRSTDDKDDKVLFWRLCFQMSVMLPQRRAKTGEQIQGWWFPAFCGSLPDDKEGGGGERCAYFKQLRPVSFETLIVYWFPMKFPTDFLSVSI